MKTYCNSAGDSSWDGLSHATNNTPDTVSNTNGRLNQAARTRLTPKAFAVAEKCLAECNKQKYKVKCNSGVTNRLLVSRKVISPTCQRVTLLNKPRRKTSRKTKNTLLTNAAACMINIIVSAAADESKSRPNILLSTGA